MWQPQNTFNRPGWLRGIKRSSGDGLWYIKRGLRLQVSRATLSWRTTWWFTRTVWQFTNTVQPRCWALEVTKRPKWLFVDSKTSRIDLAVWTSNIATTATGLWSGIDRRNTFLGHDRLWATQQLNYLQWNTQ